MRHFLVVGILVIVMAVLTYVGLNSAGAYACRGERASLFRLTGFGIWRSSPFHFYFR